MPIFLLQLIEGFAVKSVASINDTLTQIPLVAYVTRGVRGKIAFSLGNLLALSVIIILSASFSFLLEMVSFTKWIVTVLILVTAFVAYFELFDIKRQEFSARRLARIQEFNSARFISLVGVGFLVSLVTLIDDAILMTSLFVGDGERIYYLIGILSSAFFQILIVIYFGQKITKLRYRKEITVIAMVVLAFLVAFEVI